MDQSRILSPSMTYRINLLPLLYLSLKLLMLYMNGEPSLFLVETKRSVCTFVLIDFPVFLLIHLFMFCLLATNLLLFKSPYRISIPQTILHMLYFLEFSTDFTSHDHIFCPKETLHCQSIPHL